MEFMSHLGHVNRLWRKDARICLEHISLYYVLFIWWYYHRKGEYVSVSHERMMDMSGLKCKEMYMETLEELEEYGYIAYKRSDGITQPASISIHSFVLDARVNEKTAEKESEFIFNQMRNRLIFEWFTRKRA